MGECILSNSILSIPAGTQHTYINWADFDGGGNNLSNYASMYIPETVGPNTGIECRFNSNNGSGGYDGWPWIVDTAKSGSSNGYNIGTITTNKGQYVGFAHGNAYIRFYYWGTRIEDKSIDATGDITIFFDKNQVKYRTSDSSNYTLSTTATFTKTTSSSTGIYIKFNAYARSTNATNSTKIYYFNVYQDGTLTRNLIPFKQNGTLGMYDTVSNTFFANTIGGTCTVSPTTGTTYYRPDSHRNFIIAG